MNKVYEMYNKKIEQIISTREKELANIAVNIQAAEKKIDAAELALASATFDCNAADYKKAKAEKDDAAALIEMYQRRRDQLESHADLGDGSDIKKDIKAEQKAAMAKAEEKAFKLFDDAISILAEGLREAEAGNAILTKWNKYISPLSGDFTENFLNIKSYIGRSVLTPAYYNFKGEKPNERPNMWWHKY